MKLHEAMGFLEYQYLDSPEVRNPPRGLCPSSAYVGYEFEFEGTGLTNWDRALVETEFAKPLSKWYSPHNDGSLRGRDAIELVFTKPLQAPHAWSAVETLLDTATNHKFDVNRRTGLHIHLNVGNLELSHFQNLLRIYTLYEPAVYTAAGDQRSGSIFCIPWFRDMHLSSVVGKIITMGGNLQLARNFGKYSGLNLKPISNFGSVEFRHLRNTLDLNKQRHWLNLILVMYSMAQKKDFQAWWTRVLERGRYKQALKDQYEEFRTQFWEDLDYPDFELEVNRLTLDNSRELDYKTREATQETAAPRADRAAARPGDFSYALEALAVNRLDPMLNNRAPLVRDRESGDIWDLRRLAPQHSGLQRDNSWIFIKPGAARNSIGDAL